jgi:hypothetical protein
VKKKVKIPIQYRFNYIVLVVFGHGTFDDDEQHNFCILIMISRESSYSHLYRESPASKSKSFLIY